MKHAIALIALAAVLGGCRTSAKSGAAPAPAEIELKLAGPFEADAEGFIRNWLVCGPFPNPGGRPEGEESAAAACKGFNTDFLKGEAQYVPQAGAEVARDGGAKAAWKAYASDADMIDFPSVPHLNLAQSDYTLVYASCWVELAKDADVEVRVGSDDGYKLWVDHKLVATVHEHRAPSADQEQHKMKLSAGRHLILIKVDNDWGGFCFCLRVVTPDGKKVPALKVYH